MRFVKMHGAGNDYIYVNCFDEPIPDDPARLARQVSDRHFGIGGDGLVLICPSAVADARMRMFNADGSEAEMCGNAIRCVGKYLYDHGLVQKDRLLIETGRGILPLDLEVVDGAVRRARVNMGKPIFAPGEIPTTLAAKKLADGRIAVVDAAFQIGNETLKATCVSMGNPHCVIFVDHLSDYWVHEIGPRIERDSHFPRRVNVEFVETLSPRELRMRVWERGSGETLACGTGAAAVCVAAALTGRAEREVTIHLLGGDLELAWAEDGSVYKTGPAIEVFSGEWPTLSPAPAHDRATIGANAHAFGAQ
jgi:diaminopimelate epimerase